MVPIPVYSCAHYSAPKDRSNDVNIIILGNFKMLQYGVTHNMATVLLYQKPSTIGAIETVHEADLGLMLRDDPTHVHAYNVLTVLLATLETCPCPYVEPYGRWIHALRSAYEFADDTIVKLHDAYSGYEYAFSIMEIKRYLSRMGSENLPNSGILLNELLIKESARRYWDKHAKVIQTKWRTAIVDPSKEVCRRRLLREFLDMSLDQLNMNGRMVL